MQVFCFRHQFMTTNYLLLCLYNYFDYIVPLLLSVSLILQLFTTTLNIQLIFFNLK